VVDKQKPFNHLLCPDNEGENMYTDYITPIRSKLLKNEEYMEWTAQFGINYSLIEALWTDIEELGTIDKFCNKFCNYYWNLSSIQVKAMQFASIECVGCSKINRYGNEQTEEIAQATTFLRYHAGLFNENNIPDCNLIGCHHDKQR
jgi:hypothetical protein